jgi:hypothetical protein
MKLTMTDGRLNAYGPGQQLDPQTLQPVPTTGQGFDGPVLNDVVGVRGRLGYLYIAFATPQAAQAARAITGWGDGADATELLTHDLAGCLQIFNDVTNRPEFFGTWDIR